MRRKLAAVAVAALAPVVAMMAYNEVALRTERNQEVRQAAAEAARLASSEVESIVEGLRSLLIAVSAMPSVQALDKPNCDPALRVVATNVANIRTIFAMDLEGRVVCESMDTPTTASFSDRNYFRQALLTDGFAVGTYTTSRISDTVVLPVAMPLKRDGKVVGVVATGVRLDWLQDRIAERGVAEGNAITIADGEGTILARVPLPERFVGTVIPEAFRKLIHGTVAGTLQVKSQDGTERVLGYRPISLPREPLYVSAGFSTDEAFEKINRATLVNTLAIAGGALLAFLAASLIGSKFILQPVGRIASVLEAWRSGNTSARTGFQKGRDELTVVGMTLDRLLDELDHRRKQTEAAEAERTLLAGELAHRVKNSFALVQAVARQTFRRAQPELYSSFEGRLSVLARSHDLLLAHDSRDAPIRETILAAIDGHAGNLPGRFDLEGPEFVLDADLTLPLSLVLHELATNAIKYGALGSDEGRVMILWSLDTGVARFAWREEGGPPVKPPEGQGFGSALIKRAFPPKAEATSDFEFHEDGLRFSLRFRV